MCHAIDDDFIPVEQGQQIFMNYNSPFKEIVLVEGGHNGKRPLIWLVKAYKMIFKCFDIQVQNFVPTQLSIFSGEKNKQDPHFKSYQEMLDS